MSDDASPGGETRADQHSQCLLRVARHRDRAAFAVLFRHFAPLVKAFARSGSALAAAHADELVQEVMLKVWRKAGGYDPRRAAASTWIYSIARNCRTDLYRRLQKFDAPLSADDVWLDWEAREAQEAQDEWEPAAILQRQRDVERVRALLGQLPREQGEILAKVYMEGRSHSEVSAELGLPLGTVKSRVRLAMQKLQVLAR